VLENRVLSVEKILDGVDGERDLDPIFGWAVFAVGSWDSIVFQQGVYQVQRFIRWFHEVGHLVYGKMLTISLV